MADTGSLNGLPRATRKGEALGNQPPIAFQWLFLVLSGLSSLPCVSKASSFAPKIPQKLHTERCCAVFAVCLLARQAKSRRQYFVYYQGILRSIDGRQSAKTCWGLIPQSLEYASRSDPPLETSAYVSTHKRVRKHQAGWHRRIFPVPASLLGAVFYLSLTFERRMFYGDPLQNLLRRK